MKEKAKAKNLSMSKFVAETMARETHVGPSSWSEGYFERVFGKWEGKLERPEQLPYEERESCD